MPLGLRSHGAVCVFFPPHFTPRLQPLDQAMNREFKRHYSAQWAEWFQTIGCFGRTPKANRKAVTEDEADRWVANALSLCTAHIGRVSWYRSTCAAPHLLQLPAELWRRVLDYLPASQTVPLVPLTQHHRRYYSAVDYKFLAAAGDREEERKEEEEETEAVEERGEEE